MFIRTVKVTDVHNVVIAYQLCIAQEVGDNFGFTFNGSSCDELLQVLNSRQSTLKKLIGSDCFTDAIREVEFLRDRPANVGLTKHFTNDSKKPWRSYNSGTNLVS